MIRINRSEKTREGRLYPRYVGGVGLILETNVERDWVNGFDIEGSIIFDVDQHNTLCSVEILLEKKYWIEKKIEFHHRTWKEMDLSVSESVTEEKSFDINWKVYKDSNSGLLLIDFGVGEKVDCVCLSAKCWAIIRDGCLVGFYIVNE